MHFVEQDVCILIDAELSTHALPLPDKLRESCHISGGFRGEKEKNKAFRFYQLMPP
ncbi:hypothetical protein COCNU_15G004300 [Cocos nucifera]|uniref:Uncharacterized protein n=1 Tax=Cocos nucifera TaxID=13894 RepID=A0A8K0IX07_COCNU|nr:hypothetical protein COCNU_15G004300 [Cocos nucifera]